MYMCLCKGLTESGVRDVITNLAQSGLSPDEALDEDTIIEALGLDGNECCGQCVREIDRFINLASSELLQFPLLTR